MSSKTSKKRPGKRKPPAKTGNKSTKVGKDSKPPEDQAMETAQQEPSPVDTPLPLRPEKRRPRLLAALIVLFSVWIVVLCYLAYRVNF